MVIITWYTSRSMGTQCACPPDGLLQPSPWESPATAWWNTTETQFWRGIFANLATFTFVTLIGWQLAKENEAERWRCLCVMLCSTARKSALAVTERKVVRLTMLILQVLDIQFVLSWGSCQ